MRLHTIDYVLWFTTPALMTVLAVAMYRRRLHKDYPYFFNYVIFQVLDFLIEFPLRNWENGYFYVYWTMRALSIAVSFAVLLEIFKDAFRPYEALRDLSVILFRWCALVVLLVAGMWAITSWRGTQIDNVTNAIFVVDRSVRMMQCGLVLFMLLFSEYLGISRRNVLFGIAVGFGFFAAVNMLVMTALTHQGVISKANLSRISGLAYIISTLMWLAYAVLPATARVGMKQAAEATHKWDRALDDARNPAPAVSLLDTMDQTVERLLYHRGDEVSVSIANRR
jgi:predicted transporter